MKQIKNFIFGIILGIANVIPGVSGGTMAVILNIYDDILYAISWKNFRKHLPFLIMLGVGALVGLFLFSQTATYLLEYYEMPVYYSFIGLIIGSIPLIYKKARHEKAEPRNLVIFVIALAIMITITILNQDAISIKTLETVGGPSIGVYLWLFFATAISTGAMVLPGISGSLIMLLLGTYTIVMEAIAEMHIPTLLPIALGVVAGGFVGIKTVKILLRFHPQALYFGILGLIIGSLFSIYPGAPTGPHGLLCIVLMLLFATVSYFFSHK